MSCSGLYKGTSCPQPSQSSADLVRHSLLNSKDLHPWDKQRTASFNGGKPMTIKRRASTGDIGLSSESRSKKGPEGDTVEVEAKPLLVLVKECLRSGLGAMPAPGPPPPPPPPPPPSPSSPASTPAYATFSARVLINKHAAAASSSAADLSSAWTIWFSSCTAPPGHASSLRHQNAVLRGPC